MPAASGPVTSSDRARANEILRPYVPRLVINWLREEPESLHREVEGSLAFVDISGFTALSERLARRGKIGAELMRDTLNDVFIALLDTAYDDGAGLLKWGGDALLLLFDGPEHEQRACRAAWEMQRTLDRVGRLRAGGATIVLRMSIGITTGTFQFFLTGSVHRELLIAGPAATETVTMEAIADAGEIAISPRLAARLDPTCVGAPKDAALLLAAPPAIGVARAPDVGDVRGLDLPSCLPLAVRSHVMLERSEPEHRTITAAFIDLMDTDALLDRLGPDGLGQALDERIRTIQEVALRYEVPFYESDVGKSSVKALLTAGAPSTTGHDEERMLRALREIVETPGEVPIRVGVNTGRVFTGDFGPPYRRSYRVFGDAINTAARVMSKAEAGQILATEIVLERSQTSFATTPVEPFAAKGKSEPIRASLVGPLVGRRATDVRETPFVGRERELETLLRVVEDARASRGWIVELSGGAGLGKTRLLHDLIARAGDVFVFHTRCEEYEAGTPYFPLRAPFRAVVGLSPDDGPDAIAERLRLVAEQVDPSLVPWLPLFGVLLGVELPPTPETKALDQRFIPEQLADVLRRFLYTSLAGTTTMLVVEDAQHMDESSRGLLRRLAVSGADRKQVLVVTHDGSGSLLGDDALDELRALSFSLAPLSLASAIAMVNAATDDDPLPPHVVEEIARRAGGSPLFLFELLDVVRQTGSIDTLPDSVEAVVAADIDRLSPEDRTVLRHAAVLGTRFDPALIAAAVDEELDAGVWDRLAGLVERDELVGEVRFRNTLIRDAAYEGLPFRLRRELHARVAETIEGQAGEEDLGALALHFSEAQRYERAWHYCRLAGDRARDIYANVEAARFYERALDAGARLHGLEQPERAEVWQALGAVRELVGLYDASFAALAHASRLLADDPAARARVQAQRAKARSRTGAYALGLRETTAGLKLVENVETEEAISARASLLAFRAQIRWLQGHAREAVELGLQAIASAERARDLYSLTVAYHALDGAYQMLGEPENAVYERKAIEIYSRIGHIRSRGMSETNLGVQAFADGKWDEAVDWYTRAREDCARAGDRTSEAIAAGNLGEVLVAQGKLDEAESVLTDARRVLRASGADAFALFAETHLARIALLRGEHDRAIRALTEIVGEASTLGHSIVRLETAVHLAEALVVAGEAAEGLATLDQAAAAAGDEAALLSVPLGRVRAAALVALDRLDQAEQELATALASAVRQGMLYEELLIRRAGRDVRVRRGGEPSPEELQEIDRLLQLLGLEV